MTSLRILGPVQAWRGDQRLAVGGPRQLTLLAFLVLRANRAVSRDAIVDAVWGPTRSGADNRLQMAIARMRKSLEPLAADSGPWLQTVSGGYLLSIPPDELDADAFEHAVRSGAHALEAGAPAQAADILSGALALWRGPPLAEVAFEDFAQAEIRRLEELRMRGLESRIDAELQLGHHADLIGELEGLVLAQKATNERLAGQLMLALYRCGRQADALGVYHRVRTALASELGLEPGPALKALQLEILEQAAPLAACSSGDGLEVPLGVGGPEGDGDSATVVEAPMPIRLVPYGPSVFANRNRERQALAQVLDEATNRGPRAVFVTGEPGIGKTRLVSEFAQQARRDGVLVLAGRCEDGLSLPYQPFVEALEHLIAHAPRALLQRHVAEYGESVVRLVPALAGRAAGPPPVAAEPSESERYVLFRAIEGLLAAAAAAAHRALLLVIEDLHWAEPPTLTLLRRLLSSPRRSAVVLLSTCRVGGVGEDHPVRELLADLHREPNVHRLDLTGLNSADVVELMSGIADTPPGTADAGLADDLRSTANGNPFFITELVRGLAETGALVSQHGRLRLTDGVDPAANLPVSITETLARRVRRVDDDTRRCLAAAAVIGEEFDLELVTEVVDVSSPLDAVETAVRDTILIQMPGRPARYRFAHQLMQRYLYGELGAARQTELHRKVAVAMEGRAHRGVTPVAELARHWSEAVDADTDTALRYSILAGDEALDKLAPDEARRWYVSSLGLLGRGRQAGDTQRCELLIKRGEAERQAGDPRSRETLLEAADIAQRIDDGGRLVRAALGNSRGMQSETGIVDEARIATLRAALRVVGDDDGPERAQLLAMQAAELMYSPEWDRRVQLSNEALRIARRLDDPDTLSAVLNMRFVTLLAPETLAERQANTLEAVAAAELRSDPMVRFYAYHWRAYTCIESGDTVSALTWAAREQTIADRFRQPTTLWLRYADEANLAIVSGELARADQLAATALAIGRISEPDALVCFAAQQASIAFERGSLNELVPLVEQAARDNVGVPGFRAILALALSATSRREEARRLLERAVASRFGDHPHDVTWLAVACILAQVSSRLEDASSASALYRILERWNGQIAYPAFGVWGPVALYLGSLALVLGEVEAAASHLSDATQTAIRAGAPLWEQRAADELERLAQLAH
jgi:DNA-binding SARP family transcriptional activator